jgi:hypothetical protein
MKLLEWQWDQQNYVEVEYPDAPIKSFVEFFRNGKQWRENPEQCFARWMKLERDLTDAKNDAARAKPTDRCTATTKAGEPCRGKAIEDGLCMSHARAARAA